jgi:hypothetical protein
LQPVESFWENLLSRQPDLVRFAINSVDKTTRKQVIEHLREIIVEEGWHPEQVISARTALEILAPD